MNRNRVERENCFIRFESIELRRLHVYPLHNFRFFAVPLSLFPRIPPPRAPFMRCQRLEAIRNDEAAMVIATAVITGMLFAAIIECLRKYFSNGRLRQRANNTCDSCDKPTCERRCKRCRIISSRALAVRLIAVMQQNVCIYSIEEEQRIHNNAFIHVKHKSVSIYSARAFRASAIISLNMEHKESGEPSGRRERASVSRESLAAC